MIKMTKKRMVKMRALMTLLLVTTTYLSTNAQQMLVGTYNIRQKNSGDSINGDVWSKRCQVICDQVNFLSPDVFGTQEVLHPQLLDLLKGLDHYRYIGVGRDDGKTKGEYAAIFYRSDRLRLVDSGNFWLNETPEKPQLGWDAACIRICTWGRFVHQQTGKEFYYFNLHMDHVGRVARRESAHLVMSKIRAIAQNHPVVLTGDFNVDQEDEIYSIFTQSGLLADSYAHARIRFAENGTFNNYKTEEKTNSRIDHVFLSPEIAVDAYGVLTDSYWTPVTDTIREKQSPEPPEERRQSKWVRRNPSDHYPVFVRIDLSSK